MHHHHRSALFWTLSKSVKSHMLWVTLYVYGRQRQAAHIIVIRSNAVDKLTIVDDEECWHLAANGASDRSLLELLLRL